MGSDNIQEVKTEEVDSTEKASTTTLNPSQIKHEPESETETKKKKRSMSKSSRQTRGVGTPSVKPFPTEPPKPWDIHVSVGQERCMCQCSKGSGAHQGLTDDMWQVQGRKVCGGCRDRARMGMGDCA